MKKQYRFLSLLVAVIMILGLSSSFQFAFASSFHDYEGNDNKEFDYKVDPPKSGTWYFDKDGNKVSGPTGYWVIFTVSDDGMYLRFEAHNVSIDLLSVKGGNVGYRVYEDLGNNESGMHAPTMENNGKFIIPGISHYSFDFTIKKLPAEPPTDPEQKYSIIITKEIIGDSVVAVPQFKFNLKGPGVDQTKGLDGLTVLFDGLAAGQYVLTELDYDGYESSIKNGRTINLPNEEDGMVGNTFTLPVTNTLIPPTTPGEGKGELKLHKRIEWPDGRVNANIGKGDFIVKLIGLGPDGGPNGITRQVTINKKSNKGEHEEFKDLPYGMYRIDEVISDDYSGFRLIQFGNHGDDITIGNDEDIEKATIKIDANSNNKNYWLINKAKSNEPTPTPEGEIEISKKVVNQNNTTILDSNMFTFVLDKKADGVWVPVPQLTKYIYGNGSAQFSALSDGEYRVREVPIPTGYSLISPLNTDDALYFNIVEENKVSGEFINQKDGTPPPPRREIKVQKLVDRLYNDLSGFTFRLFKLLEDEETDEMVEVPAGSLITDSTGLLNFGMLEYGDYVLYEVFKPGFIMGIGEEGSENGLQFNHSQETVYPIEVNNRRIPDIPTPKGEIRVSKKVVNQNGTTIGDNQKFTFILDKKIGGVWVEQSPKYIYGNGSNTFPGLTDGEYRVREVIPTELGYSLISPNDLLVTIYGENTDSVEFTNRFYRRPPDDEPNDPDDDDDDDDDDDTPPVVDRTPPEKPEEPQVVIPEPVPEATPEPEPEVLDEVVIVEETPQAEPVATLPKTGAATPFMGMGLGTILLGLGLFLKKKE